MRSIIRKLTFTILIALLVAGSCWTSLAEMWQPYEFKGDERFEYKVTWKEGGEQKEATYILDIKSSGQETAQGEEIFELSYITKGRLPKSQLGAEAAFGFWGIYGVSLHVLMLNPTHGFLFSQLELRVGEKMSFYGAGMVKIVKKEKLREEKVSSAGSLKLAVRKNCLWSGLLTLSWLCPFKAKYLVTASWKVR